MAATVFADYPAPPGNKVEVVVNVAGPASYTAITTGTPPSGGQTLNATDIGLKSIESIGDISLSDDGQFTVYPLFISNPSRPTSSVQLMWITAAGGAEVGGGTNLASRTVRMRVTGTY